jgi:hypothetical protein
VSHFWQNGTVLAAAMTPVLVSVMKEALRRPMESDAVRRSASKMSKVATSALPATTGGSRSTGGRPSTPTSTLPPRPTAANGNGNGDVVMAGPRRTYGSDGEETSPGSGWRQRLRGPRLRLAIVTGLLAFAVAVAALTLPELIFGGSVTSSGGRTTIFGGGSDSASKDKKASDEKSDKNGSGSDSQDESNQQDESTQPQEGSDEPSATTPSQPQGTTTQPEETPSQPETTQPAPSGGGSPVPSTPVPAPPTP